MIKFLKKAYFLKLLIISIFFLISCGEYNLQEKLSSGTYEVDFSNTSDEFTLEEKSHYSRIILILNYEGTFTFSKKAYSINVTTGKWKLHDDIVSGLLELRGDKFYKQIGRCEKVNSYTYLWVNSNGKNKKLPFKKIKNQFPELSTPAGASVSE